MMFQDQVIIITGGSSGAGKELASRLAARGANLALLARDREKLAAVKHELAAKLGAKLGAVKVNVHCEPDKNLSA